MKLGGGVQEQLNMSITESRLGPDKFFGHLKELNDQYLPFVHVCASSSYSWVLLSGVSLVKAIFSPNVEALPAEFNEY